MHWNGRLRGTTRFVDGHAVVQGEVIDRIEGQGRCPQSERTYVFISCPCSRLRSLVPEPWKKDMCKSAFGRSYTMLMWMVGDGNRLVLRALGPLSN